MKRYEIPLRRMFSWTGMSALGAGAFSVVFLASSVCWTVEKAKSQDAGVPSDVPAVANVPAVTASTDSVVANLLATPWTVAPDADNPDRRAVFNTYREKWRPILAEMRELQTEYRQPTTSVARQQEIATRFRELEQQSLVLVPDVARAALEAYCQDPSKNGDIFDFLASYIVDNIRGTRFDDVLRYCQKLIDSGCPEPMPAAWAAVAAMRLGDFDKAKEYLLLSNEKYDALHATPKSDDATDAQTEMNASEFLYAYLRMACENDDYEVAYDTSRLLLSINYQGDAFPAFAGYAAYCVNDFDMAEQQLKMALDQKWLVPRKAGDLMDRARNALQTLSKSRAEWEAELAIRQAEDAAGKADPNQANPRVRIETSKGPIVVELFENQAPNATANFITLTEKGYYTDIPFHRVLPGFMAQGGDPTGTGAGGPGYTIRSQYQNPDARKHFRGTLSMARTAQPDTEGSQFFLCFVPAKFLDNNYTAFGRVVEGMDVLAQIAKMDPENPDPAIEPDTIVSATVLNKRPHAYTFEKIPERR